MAAEQMERTEDEFEEYLNETYETVEVCGMQMDQGRILRELDPIAFRCAMADEPERWKCTECDNEYETEEEAGECCKEEEEEE